MQVGLAWDTTQLVFFESRLPRVLAYASQETLNDTAKDVQTVLVARTRQVFNVREEELFFGKGDKRGGVAARIVTWADAKEGRPYAEIEGGTLSRTVGGDRSRRLLFSYFELGGTREPFTPGAKHVAEPVLGAARPSKGEKVRPELTFKRLAFEPYYKSPGGKGKLLKITRRKGARSGRALLPSHDQGIQWRGKLDTFQAWTKKLPEGGVYQRTGPRDIRLLYAFEKPYPITPELEWLSTAIAAARARFPINAEAAIADRLAHEMEKKLSA